MKIPVCVEKVPGNGFIAKAFGLSAHAPTRDEALQQLKELMESRPHEAGELVWLDLNKSDQFAMELLQQRIQSIQDEVAGLRQAQEKPWLAVKGVYKDDPLFDEWQAAIADYRRQVDADPELR